MQNELLNFYNSSLQGLASSVEASKRFGVTNDYITYLCRKKKVQGVFIGRLWFVAEDSLSRYLEEIRHKREESRKDLSIQLRGEYISRISGDSDSKHRS